MFMPRGITTTTYYYYSNWYWTRVQFAIKIEEWSQDYQISWHNKYLRYKRTGYNKNKKEIEIDIKYWIKEIEIDINYLEEEGNRDRY